MLEVDGVQTLRLSPSSQGFAWAVYTLDTLPHELSKASLNLYALPLSDESIQPGSLWLAVPDYDKGAWQWSPVDWSAGSAKVRLSDGHTALSDGKLQVAIVASRQSVDLQGDLYLDEGTVGVGLYAYSYSDRIHLSWHNYQNPQITGFKLYYRESSTANSPYFLLATLPGDVKDFDHTLSSPAGRPCQFEHDYKYRLVYQRDGLDWLDSQGASGRRKLSPPNIFRASKGILQGGVALDWKPVGGVDGYRLYRDHSELLAECTQATTQYIDTAGLLAEGAQHNYQIETFTAEGSSAQLGALGWAAGKTELLLADSVGSGSLPGGLQIRTDSSSLRRELSVFLSAGNSPRYIASSVDPPTLAADFSSRQLPAGDVASTYSSIGAVADKPVIALSSATGLQYMRATKASPALPEDWSVSTIDPGAQGRYVQFLSIEGTPTVCYQDDSGHLVFAYSAQAEPAGPQDWTRIVLEPQGQSGALAFLGTGPGNAPAIFYALEEDGLGQPAGRLRAAISHGAVPGSVADFDIYDLDAAAVLHCRPALDLVSAAAGTFTVVYIDDAGGLPRLRSATLATGSMHDATDWQLNTMYTFSNSGAQYSSLTTAARRIFFVERSPGGAYAARQYLPYTPIGLAEEWLLESVHTGYTPGQVPPAAATWLDSKLNFAILDHDPQSGSQQLRYVYEP